MPTTSARRYWDRCVRLDGNWRIDPDTGRERRPPGEDLAAMRSGLGRPAVTVGALWPFYSCEIDDRLALRGEVTVEQQAEHAALALFGLHQQGQSNPMHRPKVAPGAALRVLRGSGKFSAETLDSRISTAMASSSVSSFLHSMRGLVQQLRTVAQPLDYNLLMRDIERWHQPTDRQRVRREWGLGYFVWGSRDGDAPDTDG